METEEYNIGLFGVIDRAKILNVTIKDADITAGGQVGVLCGYAKEGSLIANCHVSGKVTGIGEPIIKATRAGGLVGFNDGNNTIPGTDYSSYIYGVIENCSANVTVNGSTGHVGGLVGFNRGIINLSHADGKVTGENTTCLLYTSNVVIGADAEEIIIANQTRSKSENKEKRVEYWSRSVSYTHLFVSMRKFSEESGSF